MASKRFWFTATSAVFLGILAITPWSTTITIPALMTAEKEQSVFAPFPSQISTINVVDGAVVEKGDVLFMLVAPQVERKLLLAKERKSLIQSRIDRSGADDQDRASLIVLANELSEVDEELRGLERVSEKLIIRAPFTGIVADIDPELHGGLWINPKTPMAVLQTRKTPRIRGYVGEQSVFRLQPGASAKFIPDNRELPIVNAKVGKIAEASTEQLDTPYLALPYGGTIAIEEAKKNELRPIEASYFVAMVLADEANIPSLRKAVRGVSIITGAPESFYARVKKQVLKILVREMGV